MKRREVIKKILDRYFSGLIHYQYEVNHGVKGSEESFGKQRDYLQNQACDDWEEWLPSYDEILKIFDKYYGEKVITIAKAISKSIRGEKEVK